MFLAVLLRIALVILHEYRNLNIIENVIFNVEDMEISPAYFRPYRLSNKKRKVTNLFINFIPVISKVNTFSRNPSSQREN